MTDISISAPITNGRSNLQQLSIPTFRIVAPLAAISALLGDAFKMAYVEPYTSHGRRTQVLPDDDSRRWGSDLVSCSRRLSSGSGQAVQLMRDICSGAVSKRRAR